MDKLYILSNENVIRVIMGETLFAEHFEAVKQDNIKMELAYFLDNHDNGEVYEHRKWEHTPITTEGKAIEYFKEMGNGFNYRAVFIVDLAVHTATFHIFTGYISCTTASGETKVADHITKDTIKEAFLSLGAPVNMEEDGAIININIGESDTLRWRADLGVSKILSEKIPFYKSGFDIALNRV